MTVLAGCASGPFARQQTDGSGNAVGPLTADNALQRPAPLIPKDDSPIVIARDSEQHGEPPKPEIKVGTGQFINKQAASVRPAGPGAEGQVVFNFENQPIQAVVKAILGELLQENYIIAPNVGGNVTFSTSKPIRADQAMAVLETLLSWTGNTLVYEQGRYTVLQLKDALPGKLTPRVGSLSGARGYEVRVYPLRYVSPTEMAKLLKPFAKPEAVVNVDTARSMLVLSGTASELENYGRTIETFDVDWLKGMSIGVFALQHQEVAKLLPDLEKLFGTEGESPLAGMFRFMPLEQTNSLIVITAQPEYLDQAESWLRRLDAGGGENGTQLYVYDVKNVKATDLADHLSDIFGASGGGGSHRSSTSGSVAPGLKPVTIGGIGSSGGVGGSGSAGLLSGNTPPKSTTPTTAGAGAAPGTGTSDIRISPVEENNQLIIMATPTEWSSIQSAIRKLDIAPLQVHIETKILEVSLTGELQFGVQWYFAGLIGSQTGSAGQNTYDPQFTGNRFDRHRALLGSGGVTPSSASTLFFSYLNRNLEVAINAMESNGIAKVLSAPSLVVLNNQEAKINVGTQIPVVQTFFTGIQTPVISQTGTGTGGATGGTSTVGGTGSVQYLNTGVILDVKPRVNPGGLVYMDISQEVSKPGTPAPGSSNPPINQRQLQTQIVVQSGETVLLGGLISEDEQTSDANVPGLSKIPILGRLFGSTDRKRQRTELIVMITPQVITNTEEARTVTEEYQRRFQTITPLRGPAPPAATSNPVPQKTMPNDAPVETTPLRDISSPGGNQR
ncbi:MAG: type II secretion system secretin GspD [Dokdonella sp.]